MGESRLSELLETARLPAEALASIAARLSAIGLDLRVSDNFWTLRDVHLANAASGAKTATMYDIAAGPIPLAARWFGAHDAKGDVVATAATRPYDWRSTDGKREIESGEAFSSFPEIRERVRCAVPIEAAELKGIVAHSGGMWIRPDWRGERAGGIRVVRAMSEVNRFFAAWNWDVDWVWSILDRDLAARGKIGDYGYRRAVPGTAITWAGLPTRWGVLVLKSRDEIRADATEALRHAAVPQPAG
jgi:hypothetical protein